MKNLLNIIVFKSVAVFAMVLLVAIAVTSSFNPLNPLTDIGGKDRDIIRCVPANCTSIDDIGGGGKATSTTLKEEIGGSKGIKGGVFASKHKISYIGGRNSNTTGNFCFEDIGGRNGTGTPTGGEYQISDIGGRTTSTSDVYSDSDIGGRNSTGTTGESKGLAFNIGGRGNELGTGHYFETSINDYTISDIGGRNTNSTGDFTSNDVGGRGTTTGIGNFTSNISDVSIDHILVRKFDPSFAEDIGGGKSTTGGL